MLVWFSCGPSRARSELIVIAALLKIYPLVLMVLTLRERPRVFLWVNVAAATVVLATSIYFHSEIVKVGANLYSIDAGNVGVR